MRAVLRTIAQCHSHHILHRDIKPGNFMLLDHSDRSPLKAIDFGLAMPFDSEDLPRRDLGLEGTPWCAALPVGMPVPA
jgi:calcium-dependent protein kinase